MDRSRRMELALWAVGTICVAAWSVERSQATLTQAAAVAELERAWRDEAAAAMNQSSWSEQRVAKYETTLAESRNLRALGLLTIPAVDTRVVVFEGTDERVLDVGAGRVPGTARLGDAGNLAIAAHRDGFFRGLRNIKPGDEVSIRHANGTDVYVVSQTSIVSPDDVSVLAETSTPAVTLITCYPFYFVGDAPERFIVRADLQTGPDKKFN